MKTLRQKFALILALMITMLLLCSCGSSGGKYSAGISDSWYNESAEWDYGWDMDFEEEAILGAAAAPAAPTDAPNSNHKTETSEDSYESQRKIIKNGNLSIETLEFDKFIRELEASVATYNGYVEYSSQYGSKNYRSASYTIRVPYQKYDEFVSVIGDLGTVTSSNTSVDDVTLQYVDIEARISALIAQRDSYMSLLDRANTIEEILQIQSYLTDVNYQIESYTSQLNTLKNKVSYSTVTLNIDEVARVTPAEPKTVWERISQNLSENMYDITEGLKDLFVGIVSATPYLVIYAIFIGIIVVIVVMIHKANKRRAQRRLEEFMKNQERNDHQNGIEK